MRRSRERGVTVGREGIEPPAPGKDLVYSQVQPTNICIRPISVSPFDNAMPNERKPGDSHTMPRLDAARTG